MSSTILDAVATDVKETMKEMEAVNDVKMEGMKKNEEV